MPLAILPRPSTALLLLAVAAACSKPDGSSGAGTAPTSKPAAAGAPGGKPPERKVPVLVEAATQRDIPITLEGLGTVTPLATVSLKSQIDGRLVSVSFKEGALVKKGDVLAQIDPRPFQIAVAQTGATLARDVASLRNARLTLSRSQQLLETKLVPQQQVDDQQTAVDQLVATVGMDQAALDNARLQLEYSRVVSPVDGVAGLRQVDPGNLVHAADATGLVVLTQLDPMTVVFTLPQDELPRIQKALAAGVVPVEAWSRDGRTRLAVGEVSFVDNQVSAATATVRLKGIFPNPDRALWPGAFVKARLPVEWKRGSLVVAAAAVQRGPQGAFVYVATPENLAQPKPVDVDLVEGVDAVLRSGLVAGDRVIVDGQSQLKPGAPIEPRNPGAEAARGSK
jgi:membrane fusion protein, multidrug efflux system